MPSEPDQPGSDSPFRQEPDSLPHGVALEDAHPQPADPQGRQEDGPGCGLDLPPFGQCEQRQCQREQRRDALHEPYRTLLGHLRHESVHYYWQRLVDGSDWLAPFRTLFGDERVDYGSALQRHYDSGPPADWGARHVRPYASSHPWEDWAETWAHYLHLVDTLDTARGFGLDGERVELHYERWHAADLDADQDADPQGFVDLVNGWMELTGVLNELSRSMGLPDFYPFVLSRTALPKLHLVHRIVQAQQPGCPVEGRLAPAQPADKPPRDAAPADRPDSPAAPPAR